MLQGGVVPDLGEQDLPSLDLSSEFFSLPQNQNTGSVTPEATASPLPDDAGFDEIYNYLQSRAQQTLANMSREDRMAKWGAPRSEQNMLNEIEDEIATANERAAKTFILETKKINKNNPSAAISSSISLSIENLA